MKGFIILYDCFRENKDLLEIINNSTNEILEYVCPEAKENFLSFCSTIEYKDLLEMAMTYVYGKHLKEIQSFFNYEIDLYNFLSMTVLDENE